MNKTIKERLEIIETRNKIITDDIVIQIKEKYGFKLDGLDTKFNDRRDIITFTKKIRDEKTFIMKAVIIKEPDFAILNYVSQIYYINGTKAEIGTGNYIAIGAPMIEEALENKDNSLAKEWNKKIKGD